MTRWHDEGEEHALDDAHPDEPGVECVLQAKREVIGGEDVADVCGAVCAHNADGRTKDNQEGHHCDEPQNLGQNEIVGRVHAHDVQGINLLGDAHRAEF